MTILNLLTNPIPNNYETIDHRVFWILILIYTPIAILAQETPSDFLDLKELIYVNPDRAIEAIQKSILVSLQKEELGVMDF